MFLKKAFVGVVGKAVDNATGSRGVIIPVAMIRTSFMYEERSFYNTGNFSE